MIRRRAVEDGEGSWGNTVIGRLIMMVKVQCQVVGCSN